jgi:ribosomal protein S18 acetylase RimI-like enzyme
LPTVPAKPEFATATGDQVDVDIRAPRRDEADDVFAVCSEAFASRPERREPWLESKRMEEFLGAWVGDELVATTEVMPVGQFFGGRSVPMGAVASVAVRPDHRGRGIAPRLLALAVERMHAAPGHDALLSGARLGDRR